MINDYIDIDTMIALDIEWSDFLNRIPEQIDNSIFVKERKRHLVKMHLKYKVSMNALKKRYETA